MRGQCANLKSKRYQYTLFTYLWALTSAHFLHIFCALLKFLLCTSEISTVVFWRTTLPTSAIITAPFSNFFCTSRDTTITSNLGLNFVEILILTGILIQVWRTVFVINYIHFYGKSKQTKCYLDHDVSQEIPSTQKSRENTAREESYSRIR